MRTAHPAATAERAAGQTVAAAALSESAAAAAAAATGSAARHRLARESLTDLHDSALGARDRAWDDVAINADTESRARPPISTSPFEVQRKPGWRQSDVGLAHEKAPPLRRSASKTDGQSRVS